MIPPEGGGPVSGRAIRMSQFETQMTVGRRRLTWEPGIKQILSLATKLGAAQGYRADENGRPALALKPKALEPRDLTVTFGDGLPPDSFEDAQEQTLLRTSELTSTESALRVLHPAWTDEQVTEELDRIKGDRATAPTPGAPSLFGAENAEPNLRERVGA